MDKKVQIVLGILVVLLFLAGCTSGNGQKFTSKEKGFTLKLPKDWVVGNTFKGFYSTTFHFMKDRNYPDDAYMTVTVMDSLKQDTTVQAILEEYRTTLPENFKLKARSKAPYATFEHYNPWMEHNNGQTMIR